MANNVIKRLLLGQAGLIASLMHPHPQDQLASLRALVQAAFGLQAPAVEVGVLGWDVLRDCILLCHARLLEHVACWAVWHGGLHVPVKR